MVKCFKLLEIQACTAFNGFLRGDLLGQNRVVSRRKHSIFTIAKIVNRTRGNTKQKIFTVGDCLWITEKRREAGKEGVIKLLFFRLYGSIQPEIKGKFITS